MKVCLIRPPYVIPLTSVYGNKGTPPLGLVYLAAALEGEGHDVTCIDAFAEAIDAFTPIDNSNLLANGLTIEKIIGQIYVRAFRAALVLYECNGADAGTWRNTS